MINYNKIYNCVHENNYMDKDEIGAYIHIERIINEMNLEYSSIIDIGCSIGNGVQYFNDRNKICKGMDISDIAIKIGKDRNKNLDLYVGDITNIPFKDKDSDLVICSDVLEHLILDDIHVSIKELIRISKKYIVLKIAHIKESASDHWITILNNNNVNEIDKLHLTILPSNTWQYILEKNLNIIKKKEFEQGFTIFVGQIR